MRCCAGFFMGTVAPFWGDLLIPFLGTNPTGELITSGLPVNRSVSSARALCG
jgi:hypothetical protein